MKTCHRCGARHDEPGQPGFNNLCARCGMPLHACVNCRHYVARGTLRCLVESAPRILDPKAANRCTAFEFVERTQAEIQGAAEGFDAGRSNETPGLDANDARQRWDQLFEEDQG